MTHALGLECLQLSEELAALSARTDAARAEAEATIRARLAPLAARARELRAALEREGVAVSARVALAARADTLVAAIDRVDASPVTVPAENALPRDLVAELSAACADLAAALHEAPAPPRHRPANHARSITHVTSGVVTLAMLRLVPTHAALVLAAGGFMAFAWTLEVTRARSPRWNAVLMKLLGPIAHPHEWVRVNSSTWYGTALFLIAVFFSRPACAVAVAVLALGDPSAGYIGRRWGRTRIRHGRSLEGSLAFVLTGTLGAALALSLFQPAPLGVLLLHAVAGALAGAVIELVSTRLDDNLTIPLAAAVAAALTGLR